MSQRIIAPCLLCGKDTITEQRPIVCYDCQEKDISTQDMKMGKAWRENSSLEKWFPFTAHELEARCKVMEDIVRVMGKGCGGMADEQIAPAVEALWKSNAELYALMEAYLISPTLECQVHYENLVAWFVRHKTPDGKEPRPVSPEQEHFL